MRYSLLLALAALFLPACVSSRLAQANEAAVGALASAAVTADADAAPLADESMQTAADIVEATGTFRQITSLGVPAALTDKNYENVSALSAIVAPDATPAVAAIVQQAQGNAAELAGKAKTQATFANAAKSSPLGASIAEILGVLGGIGATLYGTTRGQKHIRRWWNTPGAEPASAPANADAAA